MKLYATTTSERASKGQGGNDFIRIKVLDENRNTFIDINCINIGNNTIKILGSVSGLKSIISQFHIETKGKSQKGENLLEEKPSYETLLEFYKDNSPLND